MKQAIVYFVLLCSLSIQLVAQQERTCATMDYMKEKLKKNPGLQDNRDAIERHLSNIINSSSSRSAAPIITIPTVVHIVYNDATENISDAQILSQIQVLNDDFRRMNADAINTPVEFLPFAADIEIEFCLANVDPNGFATCGITRTASTAGAFGINDRIKFTMMGGKDVWDAQNYLNIWVGVIGGGVLGYAQLPGGDPLTDGIVVDPKYFGTTGTATAPFNLGRTTTHEVGHWLNLFHIWGDGNCGLDDGVADTPTAANPNYTEAPCTHPGPNSCTEAMNDLPDMFQNFMDYSDDACMNLFTLGQKMRMRALFEAGGERTSLLSSLGCANNGVLPTCSDGFINDKETGIDCGGTTCVDCASLCGDGILNGDEIGIDCGGSCPTCPPEPGQACEVAIPIADNADYTVPNIVGGMSPSHSNADHAAWYLFMPMATGTIDLESCGENVDTRLWVHEGTCDNLTEIITSDDDCLLDGPGSFNWASELTGVPVEKDKKYYIEWDDRWASEGFAFSFSFTPSPMCTDGIQNGEETEVDCGGSACFACPTALSFASNNAVILNEPCNCDDLQNCTDNDVLYFHDVLRIPTAGTTATGLTITVANATNVFIDVPCTGGTLQMPILGTLGTNFQETSPGVYQLEYWRPAGVLPTFSVLESRAITPVPTAIFAPICAPDQCVEPIPTMGEWGLILFGLLILNLSLVSLRALQKIKVPREMNHS